MKVMDSNHTLPNKLTFWLGFAVLFFLAFALRLYCLDSVPLRGDEAFTAIHWTKTPFSHNWWLLIQSEPNPGALVSYWLWSNLTGTSAFALRLFPTLAGVLGLPILFVLLRRWEGDMLLAIAVSLLAALNPFLVWHAQDARQYSFLIALTPLNFYLLTRAIDRDRDQDWRLYLGFQTFTIYLYYIELFWVAAQGLYVLSLKRRNVFRHAIRTWLVMGILLIPLGIQIGYVLLVNQYQGTAIHTDLPKLVTQFLPTLVFGENTISLLAGITLAVFGLFGLWLYAQERRLFLLWLLTPVALLSLVSTQVSLFLPRYIIGVSPVLLIALVITIRGITRHLPSFLRWISFLGLMAFFGMFALIELNDYFHNDPSKSADLPSLMDYIQDHSTPNDIVIYGPADPAIEYYYAGRGQLFSLPVDWIASENAVDQLLDTHQDIILFLGEITAKTGQLLQSQAQHLPGDAQPGVVRYRHWVVDPAEIQVSLEVDFGDVARLRGYTLIGESILLLYWEALAPTDGDYSALLHLESVPDQPVVALDHAIASAVVSTRTWTPGVIYRDPVALPSDLSPSDYTIYIGFKTESGELLSFTDVSEDDRYLAGVLHVAE